MRCVAFHFGAGETPDALADLSCAVIKTKLARPEQAVKRHAYQIAHRARQA